jgi:hypothetical protein
MAQYAAGRRWAPVVVWTGPLLLAAGFATTDVLDAAPWARAGELLGLALLASALAGLVARFARVPLATALALVWLLLHAWFAGLAAVAATAVLAGVALLIGQRLTGARAPADPVIAVLAGLAAVAALVGWLLPFAVHQQGLYLLLALPLLAWRRGELAQALGTLADRWRSAVAAAPLAAAFALAVTGASAASGWLPTLHFDDLVYHLGLPEQLLAHGYYRMDPASQVWALAPWGADVLQAIAAVLAGGEARGTLNLLWLAAVGALTVRLALRAGAAAGHAWLAVALLASVPLMHAQYASMQTELPTMALLLAMATRVHENAGPPSGAQLRLLALLAGAMIGMKANLVLMVAPLLVWQLLRWRGRLPWSALPGAVLVGVLAGGSSYVYAWTLAGNPVLPLFNQWFGSPYYWPHAFVDLRYQLPVGFDLPWRLTFEGLTFYEGQAGTFGFHWLALVGVAGLALWLPATRALACCGLVGAALMLWQVQYQRYPLPALAVLLPALVAAMAFVGALRMHAALLAVLALANLVYAANASPLLRDGALALLLGRAGDAREVLAIHAPERRAAEVLRVEAGKGYRVMLADLGRPFGAAFAGHGFVAGWYDHDSEPPLWASDFKPPAGYWIDRAATTGASHLLLMDRARDAALDEALAALSAVRERAFGELVLYRLDAGWQPMAAIVEGQRWSASLDAGAGGPQLLDYRVDIDCDETGFRGVVEVRAEAADGRALAQRPHDVACASGGPVPAAGTVHLDGAPARVEFTLTAWGSRMVPVRGSGAALRLRPDLMARRDLARRVVQP